MDLCELRRSLSPWYRVYTKATFPPKGSFGNAEPKNVTLVAVQLAHLAVRACKQRTFMQGRKCKFTETRGYLSPWYRVCTKAMLIPKGNYGNEEPKNVTLVSVQLAHFAVRVR